MDIYVVDPAAAAQAEIAFWTAIAVTAALSTALVAFAPKKAWWLLALLALLTPTLATYSSSAGAELSWRYVTEVVLPLALLGLPGALAGFCAGLLFRRLRHKSPS